MLCGCILCIHHDTDNVLNILIGYVPLKPSSVGSPNMYWSTKLKCCRKDSACSSSMRIQDYGLTAPRYVPRAWIMSWSSQITHQRGGTRQSCYVDRQECQWHLSCHKVIISENTYAWQGATGFSYSSRKPEACCLSIPPYVEMHLWLGSYGSA